jgi:serine/threonine-protein kinase RsbT
VVRIQAILNGQKHCFRASFTDEGPGIKDLSAALTDGFSTTGNLGLGLPGAKRLVDDMTIDTARGAGTTIVITTWGA